MFVMMDELKSCGVSVNFCVEMFVWYVCDEMCVVLVGG